MKEKIASFSSKTISFCKSYIELSICLAVFAVGIRFFEAMLFSRAGNDFGSSILWNIEGLCYDIALYLRISVWIIIPFIVFWFLNEKNCET